MSLLWMDAAECARVPDLPWVDEDSSSAARVRMATVCAVCPVLSECREFVTSVETTAGFWAGQDRSVPAAIQAPLFELGAAA